jgi:hypothetical protein
MRLHEKFRPRFFMTISRALNPRFLLSREANLSLALRGSQGEAARTDRDTFSSPALIHYSSTVKRRMNLVLRGADFSKHRE